MPCKTTGRRCAPIQADSANGCEFVTALESRTLLSVPAAPGSPRLSVVSSNSELQLSWTDKSNNETGFEIFSGVDRANMVKIASVGKNATSYRQAPPAKGVTYFCYVRAINGDGASPASATVSGSISINPAPSTPPTKPPVTNPTPTPPPKPTPAPPASGTDNSSGTIYIGPDRTVKSLNAAKWPERGDAPVRFVLDPGSYSVSLHFISGKLTIESADSDNPATIKLPDVWDDKGVASNPTLSVSGSLTIRNIKTTGGTDTILLGSSESGNITAENIQMDGGAIWRGNGAKSAYFKNNEVRGKPRANVYSSFGGKVGTAVIDHSGTNVPVQQGGRIVDGNPLGEAAIRIMNVDDLTLKGIKTTPWYYKPGSVWKQDVQLRPSSNVIKVINCNFYQVDVGDMTWRTPAHPIDRVEFIGCTFAKSPNVTAGVDKIIFSDCTIGGNSVSKTVMY